MPENASRALEAFLGLNFELKFVLSTEFLWNADILGVKFKTVPVPFPNILRGFAVGHELFSLFHRISTGIKAKPVHDLSPFRWRSFSNLLGIPVWEFAAFKSNFLSQDFTF